MEFNDSLHIPSDLRYDLSAPGDSSISSYANQDVAPLYNNPEEAKTALQHAHAELMAGRIDPEAYRALEDAARSRALAPEVHYTALSRIPHTLPAPEGQDRSEKREIEDKLGFLTPEHETEYYLGMDAQLGDEHATEQFSRVPQKPSFIEREKEAMIRNPASVYSWLRRNKPQDVKENENASEKSTTRPSNARTSKRVSTQIKKDEDTDNSVADVGATSGGGKNKRKRDEDASYRPKGGSNRSRKRKTTDGAANEKRNTPTRGSNAAS